jgi:hypothetical protein
MSKAVTIIPTPAARPRVSPNRRRLVGRIVFWNLAAVVAIVGAPIFF